MRAEQRAVLAFLFAVCFRKNRPKFLETSLQVYFFESQKEVKKEKDLETKSDVWFELISRADSLGSLFNIF